MITEAEAQRIAEKFLLGQHFDSKLDFTDCQLIDREDVPAYQLRGTMTMHSRSILGRFVAPKSANKYEFRIEINAQQREIIDYEIN